MMVRTSVPILLFLAVLGFVPALSPVTPGSVAVHDNALSAGIARLHQGEGRQNTGSRDLLGKPGQAYLKSPVDPGGLPSSRGYSSMLPPGGYSPSTVSGSDSKFSGQSSASKILSTPLTIAPSTVSTSVQVDGINQTGSQSNGCPPGLRCIPPDVQIAAGPNDIVEMVNDAAAIFTKQGTLIGIQSLGSVFSTTHSLSDPKVVYDAQSGRWFTSIIDTGADSVYVAISNSSRPTGWKTYSLLPPGTYDFPDQPILGINDDKVIISINDFIGGPAGNPEPEFWVLSKAEMLAGASAVDIATFGPLMSPGSVHPVQTLSSTTVEYMVSTGVISAQGSSNIAQLYSVTGAPPGIVNAAVTNVQISGMVNPPLAPQPNTFSSVQPGYDYRVLDAYWFQGKLWFGLDTGCIPTGDSQLRDCIRLTQVDTDTFRVLQDMNFSAPGMYYFYPAIRPDGNGNLNMIFGYSSQTNSTCCYPSLAVTEQTLNDPPNSLARPRTIKAGTAPDTSQQYLLSGVPRYGDYFGASTDPLNQTLIWVAGEYHNLATGNCPNSGNCWSTYVASMGVTGFTVAASPSYLNVAAGSTATSTLTLSSLGTFAGTVSLNASIAPTGATVTVDPSSVSLGAGGKTTSILTITTTSTTPTGRYSVTANAYSGPTHYSTNVSTSVGPDFSIAASPTIVTIQPGLSTSSTITLTSLNGFAGSVTTTSALPVIGPTALVNPGNVNLTSGNPSTLNLSVSTTSSMATGTYKVIVTASSSSFTHSVNVLVRVQDFATSSAPSALNFPTFSAFTANSTVKLVSLDGLSGTVSLSASVSPSGLSTSLSSPNILLASNSTGKVTLTITAGASVPPGTYLVRVTSNATINGRILTHSTVVSVFIPSPDFSLSPSPNTTTINVGSSGTVTVSLKSLNKFVGNVSLSYQSAPSGVTLSFNPLVVGLSAGQAANSTAIISVSTSAPAGPYNIVIVGTSGSLSHTTQFLLYIPGFTVSAFPNGLTVGGASSATSTISIQSVALFSQNVTLSATVSNGTIVDRPTTTLNPRIVSVSISYGASSTLTVFASSSTPPGQYVVTINATAVIGRAQVSHFTTVSISVPKPDYRLSANPTVIFTSSGSPGSTTITVASLYNFAGTVSLSAAAPGPTASLSSYSVSIGPYGNANVTLTVSGSTLGTFTATVTGISGSLNHSASVTVGIGGIVCIEDPSAAQYGNPCTSGQGILDGPMTSPVTQLRVGVFISGSSGMSSFDVMIKTNHTLLMPFGADLSNTILLGAGQIAFQTCIGGSGGFCSTQDSADTIHVFAYISSYGRNTPTPSTGLLFTAIFNIVGTTSPTGFQIGFQKGCTGGLPDGTCIAIYNSNVQDPETVQTGTFNNNAFMTKISFVNLSSQPSSIGPVTPSTQTFAITAAGQNGFPFFGGSGTVNFAFTTLPGFSGYLASSSCDTSAGGTVTNGACSVNLVVNSGTIAGNYNVNVYGTYQTYDNSTGSLDTLVAQVTVNISVFDFRFTANPTTLTFTAGTSGNTTLTISSLNGFSGTISLSTITSPTGPTATLNQTSITLSSGSARFISVTVTAAVGGLFTLTVMATSGTYSKQILIRLYVQDFSISANPASLVASVGSPTTSTIKLTSLGLFAGTLTVSAPGSANLALSLSSSSLGLRANGTNSTVLTVTGSITGNYTVTVTATSGSLTHLTSVQVRIVDFGLSSGQTTVVLARGSSGNVTISLNSINGFNAIVTLAAAANPSGPTATLAPVSVTLRPGGTNVSTFTLSAATSVTTGLYTVTLTATSASLSHTITLIVAISPVAFQVSDREVFTNVNVTTSGTLFLDSPASSLIFSGILSVVAIDSTTKAAIFAKNYILTRQPLQANGSGQYFTKFILDIAATATPLGSDLTLTLSAPTSTVPGSPSTSVVVSRNPDVLQRGMEDIVDYGFVQTRFNCSFSQSCYDPRADVAARGIIDIVDIGIMNNFFNAINFNQLQFNLTASQYSFTLQAGQQATVTVASAALGGFSGNVALSTTSPTGLVAALNQTSIKTSGAARLTLSANSAGNYTITLTGVAGGESHSLTMSVRVIDFSISANPTSLTIVKGNAVTSTLTLISLNGFSGNVTLSATISPVFSSGPVVTLTPISLVVTSNGSGISTLKVSTATNTPKGTYTITVTATSGNLVHTLSITLAVTS